MRVSWGADLPISADDFIEAAADWVGIEKCLLPEHPFKFTRIVAAPGSEVGRLPFTRWMYPDRLRMTREDRENTPDYFEETLLIDDREAYTLVYRVGDGPLGMRNYYATKEIEPCGTNRCLAAIHARFDIPAEVDQEILQLTLHGVYRSDILGMAISISGDESIRHLRNIYRSGV